MAHTHIYAHTPSHSPANVRLLTPEEEKSARGPGEKRSRRRGGGGGGGGGVRGE